MICSSHYFDEKDSSINDTSYRHCRSDWLTFRQCWYLSIEHDSRQRRKGPVVFMLCSIVYWHSSRTSFVHSCCWSSKVKRHVSYSLKKRLVTSSSRPRLLFNVSKNWYKWDNQYLFRKGGLSLLSVWNQQTSYPIKRRWPIQGERRIRLLPRSSLLGCHWLM